MAESTTTPSRPSADQVRAALVEIDIIPMLPALAQLTGDLSLLRPHLRPDHDLVFGENGGLDDVRLAEAREIACDAIMGLTGDEPAPTADPDQLREMLRFLVGDRYLDDYDELLIEELAPPGTDPKAPGWTVSSLDPDRPFRVAVIGAGMSGIAAAHRLGQAGVDVTVFEKNDEVGGTWFENSYPGCRVDVPNHLYSYSFAQTDHWDEHYSTQPVLLSYFHQCAIDTGVYDLIRFGTEVTQATWDDTDQVWEVVTDGPDGEHVGRFHAIVSGVGQLNRPKYPAIPGRDEFEGLAFHSARWPRDLDLSGRTVAVIGTGASAMQLIPFVAEDAAHLTVLQRTPAWLVPTPNYFDAVPDGMRMLFDVVPTFGRWHRLWLFWRLHEGIAPAARVDPDWTGKGSVSAFNEMVREFFTGYITEQFGDDPELLDRVLPRYPPISKRVVRDNGIWADTLRRDDVDLVTTSIEAITPTGVRLVDGAEIDVDVIIYGTGFEASKFLMPMKIVGRDGADLHERWGDDARAYLGITVPGFPNLFCLYGPNTNLVVNGSIIYFSECEVTYVLDAIRLLLETGHRSLDVRADVHDAYNAQVDEANRQMAWGASDVNTWYKNARGRITQNWPWSILEFWRRTRHVDPADYTLR